MERNFNSIEDLYQNFKTLEKIDKEKILAKLPYDYITTLLFWIKENKNNEMHQEVEEIINNLYEEKISIIKNCISLNEEKYFDLLDIKEKKSLALYIKNQLAKGNENNLTVIEVLKRKISDYNQNKLCSSNINKI